MKLNDFLNEADKMGDHYNEYSAKVSSKPAYDTLGKGNFATVIKKKSDDNHVYKISKTYQKNPDHDVAYSYLKSSMNNHTSNSLFPKVHALHVIPHNDGNIHISKMEKLHSVDDLHPSERLKMFHHTFGHEVKGASDISTDAIALHLRKHRLNHEEKGTHDPKLPEHTRNHIEHINSLISKIDKDNPKAGPRQDIHGGNIMARKTSEGHQLVLNDPVVSSNDVFRHNKEIHNFKF